MPDIEDPAEQPRSDRSAVASLGVVIPAYNESGNIDFVLDETVAALEEIGLPAEIVVVDDCSTDSTAALVEARAARGDTIRLLRNTTQQGAQPSILRGFRAVSAEAAFFLPADRQISPRTIGPCLEALNTADFVWTWRARRADPGSRKLMAAAFNWIVRKVTGVELHDIDSCVMFRMDAFRRIEHHISSDSSFIFAELAGRASAEDLRITEVVIDHHPRIAGKPSAITGREITRALADVVTIGRTLARARAARERP